MFVEDTHTYGTQLDTFLTGDNQLTSFLTSVSYLSLSPPELIIDESGRRMGLPHVLCECTHTHTHCVIDDGHACLLQESFRIIIIMILNISEFVCICPSH